MNKSKLLASTVTIEYCPDLPMGGHYQTPGHTGINGKPYTLSWYSRQSDLPQTLWDVKTEVGQGVYRYVKGVGESVREAIMRHDWPQAFRLIGLIHGINPQFEEGVPPTNYLSTSGFDNAAWESKDITLSRTPGAWYRNESGAWQYQK